MKCTFSFSLLPPLSLSYLIYNRRLIFPQRCRKSGSLSPAERQKLEEQPAGKGLQALFKGEELAVESGGRCVIGFWRKRNRLLGGRLPPTVAVVLEESVLGWVISVEISVQGWVGCSDLE
ncbi:hypothetical protein C8R41DRAFT_851021 [Lentinula lateritia]|uniref:Uncharacterized protein n=1 Tax=Lentinula lateritia TaxID=40482 RepID=A0ABQ8V709_9AGAR|nr:hypothetical protein C8R41DRAFT_851021 [Lentinula lateritia]